MVMLLLACSLIPINTNRARQCFSVHCRSTKLPEHSARH
uniref:Uncharacterized protein n=1 Tax=Setaria viridis TaxID=4556 RepID=A0A4U6V0S4_SETVI|nr:hypothetical protein SEVIR_4G073402v2 [Setaria viridis]